METLLQIFTTVIAAILFFILIAKITSSSVTNGDENDHQRKRIRDFSKLNSKMEKSSSKSKSMKKVRFAVDHDEILVNKLVSGPSETKQVVFENNHDEEMISLNDVASVETDFVGVEKAKYVEKKPMAESVSPNFVDYNQTKEGETKLVDQKLTLGTMVPDQNAAIVNNEQMRDAIIGENHDDSDENAAIDKKHQMCMKLMCDDGIDESEKEKEGLISEEEDSDDDWEGIERSDLERVFALAADYGKEDEHLQSLGSDIQMQLYGLHKVATEGPCHEAQPMALKLSARSKWNSWQKLGNMDPDVAMEQYIILLSEKVPEWSQGIHSLQGAELSSSSTTSTLGTFQKERKSEIEPCCDDDNLIGV